MSELIQDLRGQLAARTDTSRARQQQAYMKSTMPYFGIDAPELRKLAKAIFREHPLADCELWRATVLQLWREATHREERYTAIELAALPRYRKWLNLDAVAMLEEMIVTGAWWDYVDSIATSLFGYLLTNHPTEIKKVLTKWSKDGDHWRRRTAILAQLKFKTATDQQFLFDMLHPSIGEKDFFLRKAIGWALREYAKTEPQAVIDYVSRYRDQLSPLSKREALRILLKEDRLAAAP